MKKIFLLSLVACASVFAKPMVTTTILPTKYFVEQIAGDKIDVEALVVAGADPHTYEPKPSQMKSVENSDLHFAVGMEFDEIWLPKLQKQFPKLKVVKTDENIKKIQMTPHVCSHNHDEHHEEHSHEKHIDEKHDHHDHNKEEHAHDEKHNHAEHVHHKEHEHAHKHIEEHAHHEHNHDGLDPHIWLDPALVKIQADNITKALIEKYPEDKEFFEENLAKFKENLEKFDSITSEKLKDLKTNKFMVYHPSWGYFAKRYNLVQIPIEIEGKEPKPADLKELIKEAKEEGVKVIFVAPQFSQKSAKTIAKETGAKVVEIDQLPKDWFDEMQKTVDVFAKYLK